jgi:hypothetical protein
MAQNNKAYVVITGIDIGSGPGAYAQVKYAILTPDDQPASSSGGTSTEALFHYGDSDEAIRQSIVEKIRSQENDPDLDIDFVTG